MNLKGYGKSAALVLKNGVQFKGKLIGYPVSVSGEVVFNTGMVGYPETFTDPSYKGQIQCITYPLVGNYGVPSKNSDSINNSFESEKIHLNGIVISDYSNDFSHSTAIQSLSSWLEQNKIPGICEIDTRKLTQILRDQGSMTGKIVVEDDDIEISNPDEMNLVELVSTGGVQKFGNGKHKILLWDCGCKQNIIRELISRDTEITRVPWNSDINDYEYDAVVFSNGPGNPENYSYIVNQMKRAIEIGKPVLGICLGHQMMAKAAGAKTKKMRFGHRGQNQPVINKITNQCYVTSQNHGYSVDIESIGNDWFNWFENLNDGSNEGIKHKTKPFMSVQFHPEAAPGPVDTSFIFDDFIKTIGAK